MLPQVQKSTDLIPVVVKPKTTIVARVVTNNRDGLDGLYLWTVAFVELALNPDQCVGCVQSRHH